MKNQGTDGIQSTIDTLDTAGIQHAGAGITLDEARHPALITVGNQTIGFLAYTDISFTPSSYIASNTLSGSPQLSEELLAKDIGALKEQADIIIVSMHSGTEYAPESNGTQEAFARAAIDLGAALVIGHHPHVLQPIEQYNNGYIIYSLGNFVFDQMWSEPTRESVIATITFSESAIADINLIPIKIYNYCQPRMLSDEEGRSILERMNHLQ